MNDFWKDSSDHSYVSHYDTLAKSLDTESELRFLQQKFSKNQKIIECGCGTGRTLIPLREEGYDISGLDFSEAMLSIMKEKLLKKNLEAPLFQKDLTDFSLEHLFDGAIVSQRTLNFIITPEGQRKALENISQILHPGALLILSLYPPRPDDFSLLQEEIIYQSTFKNPKTGNTVEYHENWIPDPETQIWSFVDRFIEDGEKYDVPSKVRVIFPAELEYLLELCGFTLLDSFGDWKGNPYSHSSKDFIVVAQKKSDR